MSDESTSVLRQLVEHLGRFPEDAFLFVREGLAFTAEQLHGAETPAHRKLQEYISTHQLDWSDLVAAYYAGTLPASLASAVDATGGVEKLNRHISGRELCWGLRDYALSRWGLLARTVLESWNIKSTQDFGRIVFAFIDFDLMQKQTADAEDDFEQVYTFEEAFEEPFRIAHRDKGSDRSKP